MEVPWVRKRTKVRDGRFEKKFIRKNVGLVYLIVIALALGIAANVFRKDDSVLLVPAVILVGLLILAMTFRKWRRSDRRSR